MRLRGRAIGSAGERLVHTEEVTGSIPVSPTRSEPTSIFGQYGASPGRAVHGHAAAHGLHPVPRHAGLHQPGLGEHGGRYRNSQDAWIVPTFGDDTPVLLVIGGSAIALAAV